jgi:hypothetical protein
LKYIVLRKGERQRERRERERERERERKNALLVGTTLENSFMFSAKMHMSYILARPL